MTERLERGIHIRISRMEPILWNRPDKEATMKMSRILVAGVLFCALVTNAGAVKTAGKFGMGVRFWGTPVVALSNMKVGMTDFFGLEPSLGYHTWKYKHGDSEDTGSAFVLFLIGDIKPIQTKRSNLVIKLGGAYASIRISYPTLAGQTTETTTSSAVLGGIGIEHFVNRRFSVNVGTLSAFGTLTPEDPDTEYSLTTLGNQLVDFSLVWYL